jgi:glycosyltransferase involved in cell wall biosynthesis
MSRVLMVLSNGFVNDPRVNAEARSLVAAHHEVTVLCWDRAGALSPEETRDGVRIVRLRNTPYMRLWSFDLFRLRPFWRLAARRALELHRHSPFDVVHCHDLDTLPTGVALKRAAGLPLVYDAHEFFPDMIGDLSRAKPFEGWFAGLERRLVTKVDLVIVAAPGQRPYFDRMTNAPIEVVMSSRPLAQGAYAPPGNSRMKVLYIGGLQPHRLLPPFAGLAVEDDSFDVEIGGFGPLAVEIRALGAKSRGNLRYLGVVPMDEVMPRTRGADVVYSLLDPATRVFPPAAPNKLFEALAAGRPLLVSKGTWVGDEVVAADCGVAIDYSKDALRTAIRSLRDDPASRERMGRNAFRLAEQKYNWARDEANLLAAYARLGLSS